MAFTVIKVFINLRGEVFFAKEKTNIDLLNGDLFVKHFL